MTGFYLLFGLNILLLVSYLGEANNHTVKSECSNKVYIVYMGATTSSNGSPRRDHTQLLSNLIKRNKNSVVQSYNKGFLGFAARLSDEEAESIARRPEVVSVFPEKILQLHTTRSWDFLKYQKALKIDSSSRFVSAPSAGGDTIIGLLDSGIWPESDSFIDSDMGPIPSRWKGMCMAGENFTSSACNRKVIGARYYEDAGLTSPRDSDGHGTHTASTAAGRPVTGASYYGLANGTASGGSPGSRIAMYRVCMGKGCSESAILKGFDDAIADGVDVISVSVGSSPGEPHFSTDSIAIGAFHAVEKGIIVVCSAGNEGPSPSTVVNVAPWILTVAATTIDRDYEVDVVLGSNEVIKGGGITFPRLDKSPVYPLIDGRSARSASKLYDANDASNCIPGSLDGDKVKGKIVLCGNNDANGIPIKLYALQSQDATGLIVNDNDLRQVPMKFGTIPVSIVTDDDSARILSYINSTSNPVATIQQTVVILNHKPAPIVPFFSSRGPTYGINNLLNPDIAAPGVAILAAWPSNDEGEAIPGKEPPLFSILSGTSMACPHVSGLAATVKSQYPTWSPSAIRSAIMTTAIQTNNLHAPIMTNKGSKATSYDIGAGEITLSGPIQPGLVYETETIDYIQFLCNMGYDASKIRSIALGVPSNFSCPGDSNPDSISNMNYPSIAVSNLKANERKTVNRTVTNVGKEDSTYTANVEAPDSVQVEIVPNKLQFSKDVKKLSFQVTFKLTGASREDVFGSIVWSNDKYKVQSPFVISKS